MGWGASRADDRDYLDECRSRVDKLDDELAQIRRIVEDFELEGTIASGTGEIAARGVNALREIRKVIG
jgi:hypothetical protein